MVRQVIICMLLFILFATPVDACIGARYAGLGWCGVAVADDATASYWNPAALVWASDGFTYDNIYKRTAFAYKQGKYAVHCCNEWDKIYFDISRGFQLNENSAWGLSVGYYYAKQFFPYCNYRGIRPSVSYFYKINPNLSFGVLLQGMCNLRPGVCYKNDRFLISIEYYDLLNICESQNLHAGIEIYLLDFLTLRVSNDENIIIGFGIKNDKYTFDGCWKKDSIYKEATLYFGFTLF